MLSGDFNAKETKEIIFKQTIGNESLHEGNNGNDVRIENFATSKNLFFYNKKYLHRNIHKYTWTFPDGTIHNQIDHILVDRRRHYSTLDIRSFRGADCDTDNDTYLVVASLRERLAVNKQGAQKFVGERFNLSKLSELEVRKQNQIEISNRLAPLENLKNDGENINRAWENIKENIKTSFK